MRDDGRGGWQNQRIKNDGSISVDNHRRPHRMEKRTVRSIREIIFDDHRRPDRMDKCKVRLMCSLCT